MAAEIERKYLVRDSSFLADHQGTLYRQGYLSSSPEDLTVVRIRTVGPKAYLTIKSATTGIVRTEYEYEIPSADAAELLDTLCRPPLIEKTRYQINHAGHTWEIDLFAGDNQGLIVAEIELEDESQTFAPPPWLGDEVSHDPRYFNFNLAQNPYKNWKE